MQRSALLCWGALACPLSCADLGKYVWVDDYTPPSTSSLGAYVIHPGDMLYVRVFNQPEMSARERVRADGKITLPLLQDVQAAGLKPSDLAQELEIRFKDFLKTPNVSVTVDEQKQLSITVVGEVGKQGVYAVEPGTSLIHLLALAGGLNESAHKDRIFVRREVPEPARIRFNYDALTRGEGKGSQFNLQWGDVVVVE